MEKAEVISKDLLKTGNQTDEQKRKFRMTAGIFLAFVGGTAAVFGFSKTVLSSRKQDEELFEKGCRETAKLLEGGNKLATRALAWGTFYAFLGTGTFCYGMWKLSGAKNMDEFRYKMGSILPKISKDAPPASRTEFEGLTDLMKYLTTWRHEKDSKE